jgi:hypothetical protein
MLAVVTGRKARRQSWPDGHYVYLRADVLHIFGSLPGKDGTEHVLLVNSGDIAGTDWVLVD